MLILSYFTFPNIDPVAISLGPLEIRWYALAYIVGLVLGWRLLVRLVRLPDPPMTKLDVDDFVTWAITAIIIGGRLGYVTFYNFDYFSSHPLEILYVWQGGMSFHGGLIGVIVAEILFCRQRKLPLLLVADMVAVAAPLGLFFGRIANFVNAELYGRVTEVSWGVVFPTGGPLPRHPSQLYEGVLEGIVLFALVYWLYARPQFRAKPGLVSGAFLMGYGAIRFGIELVREPDAHIGLLSLGATMGQWLSIPVLLFGVFLVIRAHRA
jgi:phosphatidylglycerol:prolipoprotein diacylglycerol transferase